MERETASRGAAAAISCHNTSLSFHWEPPLPLYFTLRQQPLLKPLASDQRQWVVRYALARLNGWRQLLLNLSKIVLLVPPFILLARYPGPFTLLVLAVGVVLYPLLLRPIQLALTGPFLPSALTALNQQQLAPADSDDGRADGDDA